MPEFRKYISTLKEAEPIQVRGKVTNIVGLVVEGHGGLGEHAQRILRLGHAALGQASGQQVADLAEGFARSVRGDRGGPGRFRGGRRVGRRGWRERAGSDSR